MALKEALALYNCGFNQYTQTIQIVEMKDKIIFYIISVAIYPLLTYVIIPYIIALQSFHGDAAGNAMERAYAYLFGCAIAFVIALIVSFVVSYKWLHCTWYAVLAFALGIFLVWFHEDGKLKELFLEDKEPDYSQESWIRDVYPLKNGYELQISLSPDSIHVFTLKQDDKERVIEKDAYYGCDKEKFAIRYSEIDFDDYLVLDRWESQYSVYLYLYEKSTGKNLFKDKLYLESGYDASANLLLYLDTDSRKNPKGNLLLLNLQNLTTIEIDVRCFIPKDVLPNYYWDDFSVNKLSDKFVRITYDGERKKSIDFPIPFETVCKN